VSVNVTGSAEKTITSVLFYLITQAAWMNG